MRNALVKSGAALVALPVTASAALAQATPSAAETGVTEGFAKIQSIVDLAVPLMIGIAAVVVAAMWGLRMLKRG